MPLSIQNPSIQIGLNQSLGATTDKARKAMQSLSSGVRPQRSGEQALDLNISEKLRTQQLDLNKAQRSAFDAVGAIQTADCALDQIGKLTQGMLELAGRGEDEALTPADREKLQSQYQELNARVHQLSQTTQYNGLMLLDGSASGVVFQIGTNSASETAVPLELQNPSALGYEEVSLLSPGESQGAVAALDGNLQQLEQVRFSLGESEQRVHGALSYLQVAAENTAAASSRISDADTALQSSRLVTGHILSQSPTAIQAQSDIEQLTVASLLKS